MRFVLWYEQVQLGLRPVLMESKIDIIPPAVPCDSYALKAHLTLSPTISHIILCVLCDVGLPLRRSQRITNPSTMKIDISIFYARDMTVDRHMPGAVMMNGLALFLQVTHVLILDDASIILGRRRIRVAL